MISIGSEQAKVLTDWDFLGTPATLGLVDFGVVKPYQKIIQL
jgi:hypothetical protein